MMTMLDEAAASYRVVLTKTDKIKASELAAVAEKTAAEAKQHVAAHPEIHLTSSEKGMGIERLRAEATIDPGASVVVVLSGHGLKAAQPIDELLG